MEKDIEVFLTMNQETTKYLLPVEEEMTLQEFFISLQTLFENFETNTLKATTFDIYDLSFQRIALVGSNHQLFIDEAYHHLKTMKDLFDVFITTIKVITLGTTPIHKILLEEKELKKILKLDN